MTEPREWRPMRPVLVEWFSSNVPGGRERGVAIAWGGRELLVIAALPAWSQSRPVRAVFLAVLTLDGVALPVDALPADVLALMPAEWLT